MGINAWPNAGGKLMLSPISHSLVQQFACKLTTLAVYKKFLSRLLLSIVIEVLLSVTNSIQGTLLFNIMQDHTGVFIKIHSGVSAGSMQTSFSYHHQMLLPPRR